MVVYGSLFRKAVFIVNVISFYDTLLKKAITSKRREGFLCILGSCYHSAVFILSLIVPLCLDNSEDKEKSNAVKSEKEEDSTVIRSPFVAGAVHEECKWFGMEEARGISTIFEKIYQSAEFQKLLAKLKGIVSAM